MGVVTRPSWIDEKGNVNDLGARLHFADRMQRKHGRERLRAEVSLVASARSDVERWSPATADPFEKAVELVSAAPSLPMTVRESGSGSLL